ncbi:hypothetical protein Chor_013196 [Crotalus horridus]
MFSPTADSISVWPAPAQSQQSWDKEKTSWDLGTGDQDLNRGGIDESELLTWLIQGPWTATQSDAEAFVWKLAGLRQRRPMAGGPLMLDDGNSAPQVTKFRRSLPLDPFHEPCYIQPVSLGLRSLQSFASHLLLLWLTTGLG